MADPGRATALHDGGTSHDVVATGNNDRGDDDGRRIDHDCRDDHELVDGVFIAGDNDRRHSPGDVVTGGGTSRSDGSL